MIFLLEHGLYLPVLFGAAITTAGGVVWWALFHNNDIDPGEPNARVGS